MVSGKVTVTGISFLHTILNKKVARQIPAYPVFITVFYVATPKLVRVLKKNFTPK
jgi:hypothetical protein